MTAMSPCVGLCRIDAASSLCTGCARSRGEIAAWRTLAEDALERVWAALPARRAALGLGLHRLPWGPGEIRRFVLDSLRPSRGTWVFGVPGAVAEVTMGDGEAIALCRGDDVISAATRRGAVRFSGFERMRALSIGREFGSEASGIIALVVPREQAGVGSPPTLTSLGPDDGAVDLSARGESLFDLGLGVSASRFCIRVSDPELCQGLDAACGQPWREFLPRLGPLLIEASPARVVISPVGRAEVFTPIPPPGAASPSGPHTHLLPASLAAGHEAPPALGIPATYAVGALHYPDPTRHQDHHHVG